MTRYRRKPRRSRRIVKKLLKRADRPQPVRWDIDAISVDGGRRWVSAQQIVQHGLEHMVLR
jgi:hypothetical protein